VRTHTHTHTHIRARRVAWCRRYDVVTTTNIRAGFYCTRSAALLLSLLRTFCMPAGRRNHFDGQATDKRVVHTFCSNTRRASAVYIRVRAGTRPASGYVIIITFTERLPANTPPERTGLRWRGPEIVHG